MYSPTWGFFLDLPEDYVYIDGNELDRYSFANPDGAMLDLIVYNAEPGHPEHYPSLEDLVQDVQNRLNNRGGVAYYEYRQRDAFIMELSFVLFDSGGRLNYLSGWAFFAELDQIEATHVPMLAVLAYGPAERRNLEMLHLSALNSIAPREADRLAPGPITEFSFPRETPIEMPVFDLDITSRFYAEDAEGAQYLIEREFEILVHYSETAHWRDAWIRYYRAIFRDSFERLAHAAFQIDMVFNTTFNNRDFAESVLGWVQNFNYERDFSGSDFVNLVSALTEGRGDCDTRAMLMAVILNHSNISSGIMVSREFSHAMCLVDLPGTGARFETEGNNYLVAETTAPVRLGLISQSMSDVQYWIGILF